MSSMADNETTIAIEIKNLRSDCLTKQVVKEFQRKAESHAVPL